MKYSHILAAFHSTAWAILPEKLAELRHILAVRAAGGEIDEADIKAAMGSSRPMDVSMVGRVACLPVFGTISQRMGLMERCSGGVSTEELGATLDSLVADRGVKSVLMCFDSPGGSVFGIGELADKIRGYKGEKKIIGIADSMAASGAYWLAAQCQELYVTPGGQVGSIGVFAGHTDYSKQEEEEGVKTTLISAGKYKTEMASHMPLSEEARAELQSKVDSYYAAFLDGVARGRDTTSARVKADFGQGRMMTARQAKDAGAADGIKTLAQVLDGLGAYEGGGARADAAPPAICAQAAARSRSLEVNQS